MVYEKIKLNDGTSFKIQSGTDEYVNIINESTDDVVKYFTDANLKRCEISTVSIEEEVDEETGKTTTTESEGVRAIFTNKHMKNFSAVAVEGGFDIVITFAEVDEVFERLSALEETVDTLVLENLGL